MTGVNFDTRRTCLLGQQRTAREAVANVREFLKRRRTALQAAR